jgi:hypothetical protein
VVDQQLRRFGLRMDTARCPRELEGRWRVDKANSQTLCPFVVGLGVPAWTCPAIGLLERTTELTIRCTSDDRAIRIEDKTAFSSRNVTEVTCDGVETEKASKTGRKRFYLSGAVAPNSKTSVVKCRLFQDERASFGWSPAALAEYRQYAARVDELREASRARLAETRCAYDEHNALVETNEFVRRETALLDSLFAQILDATRGARADAFSGQAVVDDRARFALEASLRRAREGVEAVLRKSTAKRAKSERALRDAKEAAAAAEDDARREAERFDALAAALPCHSTS